MHKHAPPHQHGAEGVSNSGRQGRHAAPGEQARLGGEGGLYSGRQRGGRGSSDAPEGGEGVLYSGRQHGGESDAPEGRERASEHDAGFAQALLSLSSSAH